MRFRSVRFGAGAIASSATKAALDWRGVRIPCLVEAFEGVAGGEFVGVTRSAASSERWARRLDDPDATSAPDAEAEQRSAPSTAAERPRN